MNPSLQLEKPTPLVIVALLLVCFAFSPQTRAACDSPDPGCPGGNLAEGYLALGNLSTGIYNTGIGLYSLLGLSDGSFCTGVGAATLIANTGSRNTATGAGALLSNMTGSSNTANGAFALLSNTTGDSNTAMGREALLSNINGVANTAVGDDALFTNTDGNYNTANGGGALFSNTSGSNNTAIGENVLVNNDIGSDNTAVGWSALLININGANNTAIGSSALQNSVAGFNTAVGFSAGSNVIDASNVTCIGANVAGANVSNTTWIGNIYGVTTQSGTTAAVIVSDDGQLGTVASSERFKKDITNMQNASEAILSLRPVTFHYKTDTKGTPQFGLIAEEVAKVNPALVLPDKQGKPYTVRYEAVNAMLLNEFLKEHRKVEQLEKQIEALTVGLQKVNAQLEATKLTRQVVVNAQ